MWFEQMHPEWQALLASWKPWLASTEMLLSNNQDLAPTTDKVMTAFQLPPSEVRIVVIGQDPYPTKGFAIGRAFAVSAINQQLPASLRNIFTELQSDLGEQSTPSATLESWQEQGVWLLNRHLTTLHNSPGAHFSLGWESFTGAAVEALLDHAHQPMVFVLWGKQAQSLKPIIEKSMGAEPRQLLILESVHPSPLSAYRGFFGSKPFSKVNDFLSSVGQQTIDWFD